MSLASERRNMGGFKEIVLSGVGDMVIELVNDPNLDEGVLIEADHSVLPHIRSELRGQALHLGLDLPWWEWPLWGLEWLFIPEKTIRYRVYARELNAVSTSGAGNVSAAVLNGNVCRLKMSGAGKITLGEWQGQSFEAETSGSGRLDLGAIHCQTFSLHTSGSADIQVSNLVCQSLKNTISGAGQIRISGSAENSHYTVSGGGQIDTTAFQTQIAEVNLSGSANLDLHVQKELKVKISGAGRIRYAGSPLVSQNISGAGSVAPM